MADQYVQEHEHSRKRSAASILGCGCALLVGLFLVAVVATTLLTYRAGKRMADTMRDPETASAAVREVLPYDTAPDGYHAIGNLSIPWVMDVVFLGGPQPPQEGGEMTQGFVFVRIRDWFGRGDTSRDWLESGESDDAPIAQEQLRFDPEETVDRGELAAGGADVAWVARRGRVEMDLSGLQEGEEEDEGWVDVQVGQDVPAQRGIVTVIAADCPEDDGWQRLAVWFTPDPAPERPAAEVDWSGTPADPEALADHLGHFRLCP